ncbi:MAG: recombinase family protein, partial [Oscillospiraceae bacterium]
MPKIGSGYIRVSTEDQEEYSPDSQIKILREYAKTHDIILPDEYIFRDDGISGRKAGNRPEFMRMISMAKSDDNPFEIILVWKFSRFARNQEESIVYKSLLKNQHNVEVISVSEPLPEGPFGSLVERIIEWTDEYYSIRLSGEVRRGMTERVSRGEAVTVAPYGYLIENGKLTVAEDEAQIVRMIYEDFLNGMSMYAIAAKTQNLGVKTKRGNVMRSRTIRYILTNPVYCGKLRWCPGGINDYTRSQIRDDTLIIDGQHSGIVDEATFAETEQRLQSHLKRYKSAQDKRVQRQDAGAK